MTPHGALRAIGQRARAYYAALGIYIVAGALVAIAGTWIFADVAEHVARGSTLAFDRSVLVWMGAHQSALATSAALEITALGTGSVVVMLAAVAALFLGLGRHPLSAWLVLIATAGGLALNGVLKHLFARPRPTILVWGTHVASSSFPSGHATNAVIAYFTIALLAARLERRAWMRWATIVVAVVIVIAVCASRLYLGVHYPTDVAAGVISGAAWTGCCASGIDAARVIATRSRAAGPGRAQERDRTRADPSQ